MNKFYFASGIYLGLSLILFASMFLFEFLRSKRFAKVFGAGRLPADLTEKEMKKWALIHNESYDSGFWRLAVVFYMFYHYPGFLVSVALTKNDRVSTWVMFVASAAIYIGVFYLVFRPDQT